MNNRTKAIIVDDEPEAIKYLSLLIAEYCPELQVCETANTSKAAIEKILKYNPEIVFLDVEIDDRTGFDVVSEICKLKQPPHIIFVTAHTKYAINAFKANALDFLLKPVEAEELIRVVNKFKQAPPKNPSEIYHLLKNQDLKLRFNTFGGFFLLNPSEILYCQADRNYSRIYTKEDEYKLVSINLAELERKLSSNNFWRISRFHLVNRNKVVEVKSTKRICVIESDGKPISLTVSKGFLQLF